MKENLLEKLFNNECTEEELRILLHLIRRDDTPPSSLIMDKLWDQMAERGGEHYCDTDGTRKVILDRIVTMESNHGIKKDDVTKVRRRWVFIRSAAAALVVLVGAYLWTLPGQEHIITAYGEWQSLTLSDGSKVQLNANSSLTYDKEWQDVKNREIWLEGEAFFEVEEKLSRQKFKVITDDIVVEVLGTSFNVNTNNEKTTVFLEEGSIRLYLSELDSSLMMQEGDLIVYSKKSKRIMRNHKEKVVSRTSWKNGVVRFQNQALRDVLQKIENIYGVNFVVNPPEVNSRRISFPLPIDNLEKAILILDKTLTGLQIEEHDGQYHIK